MSVALAFEAVSVRKGGATVVDDVSLELRDGEIVAMIGPSGAGKSTLVRLALGLDAPDRGIVRLGERVASEAGRIVIPPERRGLAVVFQDLALWPHMSVEGNLRFVAGGAVADKRITQLLDVVGLADKRHRRPAQLSGGEQQRVAIARALVAEPSLVLLDEPLASLDVVLRAELRALCGELFRERGTAALYVTHDPTDAKHLADRVVVLERGAVSQVGSVEELVASPASEFVARAFGD